MDDLIEYFEPTGATNTITMNEKNNLNRKLFWLTKWLSKVLQTKPQTSVSHYHVNLKRSAPPNTDDDGDFEDLQVTKAGSK